MSARPFDVAIVGGGIAGLTLALTLNEVGISSRVFEAAQAIDPLGVGINVLPHASKVLCELGLGEALGATGVETQEAAFFNRFGQLIYAEPCGRAAGYRWPQYSLHRGDLQRVLLDGVIGALGADAVALDHRCTGVEQEGERVTVFFTDGAGQPLEPAVASLVVACDGVHSAIRRQLHPTGRLRYSGVHMWRGVTKWEPYLTGASMVRAGWLATGKMVIYPIRHDVDGRGLQLVNWVAEVERSRCQERDWNRRGSVADFIEHFADWHFDWLDVPALIRSTEVVLEYPMVDQEPLDRWTCGRVTLLGDAAHPMVPRGSNGAGQAILDARCLADHLRGALDPASALAAYEAERRPATSAIVRMSRHNPPDAVLREVHERTGDRPFERIEDIISADELRLLTERYRIVTGHDRAALG